ncbi:MAG: EAL domain-containing protein [Pseudomonadota bacterium]
MTGFRLALVGLFTFCTIWFAVHTGVDRTVNNVIHREAIDKASHWAYHMPNHIPEIERLVSTGIPTEAQRIAVLKIKELGDIFRFKLFTADGRLSVISDNFETGQEPGIAAQADPEPRLVAQTQTAIVNVFDGTLKADRPDLYAEAYVPLRDENGTLIGVVEVYIDQTKTAAYFKESFQSFGVMLMLLCAAVFIAPTLAFFAQRRLTQRSRKDAEFLARFDPLTGLLNRREFTAQARSYIANGEMSVACYLDCDNFKHINDTHGHAIGDAFLAHIANVLRRNCRKDDLVARFGGDEFVIGFHGISIDAATQRVRTILKECGEQIDLDNANVAGSVSIGVVQVKTKFDLDTILKHADTALYFAKTSGRNNFAIYGDEMGDELRQRYEVETVVRKATETKAFEIYFQPLVSSKDKEIIGHEALLRLRDKNGDFIPPAKFVPIAEDLGLIDEIGRWTIQNAIAQASDALSDKIIAINLSPIQFESGDLVETVRGALTQSDFPAEQLELEITESLLLEDSIAVEMQIDALREMGVRIAMDDFGTGFSSLSYLWKYGFDRLKIDRSFVAALDEDSERSREIIESVVMLGTRLNMRITAEGVETPEQSKFLSDLGCDTLQGYLYGKPAPFRLAGKAEQDVPDAKAG